MSPSEVANQLKSQSYDTVLPSAFKQVGGRVFPDLHASQSVADLVRIVDGYRATHLPSYGSVIPDTGTGYMVSPQSADTPVDFIAPANNEVIKINAISVQNDDSGAIAWKLTLGDTVLVAGSAGGNTHAAVPPGEVNTTSLILSKGQTIRLVATSGTVEALTLHASGVKTCL